MNGDSGQIEFERGGVNRPRFSYNGDIRISKWESFFEIKNYFTIFSTLK